MFSHMFDSCIHCIQSTFVVLKKLPTCSRLSNRDREEEKVCQSEDLYICTMRDFYDYTAIYWQLTAFGCWMLSMLLSIGML